MESEEKLTGGNSSIVARVGVTVRRETRPWTARVHGLLAHLRSKGVMEVPAPLGFDDQGREILTFIPGKAGHAPTAELLSEDVLVSAARLLRRIHDASEDIAAGWDAGWQAQTRQPVEVICHGDFAPYNCVFDQGRLVGVIDFDHAHPGSRAWDLAYALYRFAPIAAPSNPDHFGSVQEQSRRARLFCDMYGMRERVNIVQMVQLRITAMAEYLRNGAAQSDQRILTNIAEGHLEIYLNDLAFLEAHYDQFARAIEVSSQ
jgi:aminoglycoside phosphotransferase